jgi:hypothetical protein
MIQLLLFQATESTPTFPWLEVFAVVAPIVTGLIGYYSNRPKQKAEVAVGDATARRTDTETVILSGDKLIEWIGRFETAKTEAIAMEDELADLQRKLDNCHTTHQECTDLLFKSKNALDDLSTKLGIMLHDFAYRDGVLASVEELKIDIDKKLVSLKFKDPNSNEPIDSKA